MKKYINNETLIEIMRQQKIFPVMRGKNANKIIETAKEISKGGLEIIEINIETSEMFNVIEEISSFMTVCAGGIITSFQAQTACECGAKAISSPIFQPNLLKFSKSTQIPYIAGATTANEAYNAWKSRIPLIRLYPITAMGGAMYLEDILRPMPFLNVMPAGDIKLNEVKTYLEKGSVAVGVGRDIYTNCLSSEISTKLIRCLKGLN